MGLNQHKMYKICTVQAESTDLYEWEHNYIFRMYIVIKREKKGGGYFLSIKDFISKRVPISFGNE